MAQHRRHHRRGGNGVGEGKEGIGMNRRDDFPPSEESIGRLHRSGWSTGEAAWTGAGGRTVSQVDGSNGENKILAAGATARRAWWCAVEMSAARGMLRDWPRPSSG